MKLILMPAFSLAILFTNFFNACAQGYKADTSTEVAAVKNAVELYHRALSPQTGLFNGSEYAYNAYYPFKIDQGDPFFKSNIFDTGSVFYAGILYEKIALLFDIVQGELLTHDPTNNYIIRLNNEQVGWFVHHQNTFIRLHQDTTNADLRTGFYDLIYAGNTRLYKKISKIFAENTSSFLGINKYLVEVENYFIQKDNQYYTVNNKNALLITLKDKKKQIGQYIKKNKLNLRTAKEESLMKIVTYYDALNTNPVNTIK